MAMFARWWWCVLAAILSLSPSFTASSSIVNKLPGFDGDLPFKLETGYIEVGEVELFYYFVESQRSPSTDPLFLWLVGGPGCSALNALLVESGPLKYNMFGSSTEPKLKVNPNAWTKELNVLYVDSPVGAGFSYSKTQEGYPASDKRWVEHVYGFLKKWFVDHPKFETNPFYIGGVSYATIPVPPLVQKVYEGYKMGDKPVMNLKGFVLGSPFGDLYEDVNGKAVYANMMGAISNELYESMKANCNGNYVVINGSNANCVSDYTAYEELTRYFYAKYMLVPVGTTTPNKTGRVFSKGSQRILQLVQETITALSMDGINTYEDWANTRDVRNALHIREGTKGNIETCNSSLAYTFDQTNVLNYHQSLANTNLRALIYSGDLDSLTPLFRTRKWIAELNLSIHDRWRPWFDQQQPQGFTQTYSKNGKFYLTYATVKGAGHIAQLSKPREVYRMIKRWLDFSPI